MLEPPIVAGGSFNCGNEGSRWDRTSRIMTSDPDPSDPGDDAA